MWRCQAQAENSQNWPKRQREKRDNAAGSGTGRYAISARTSPKSHVGVAPARFPATATEDAYISAVPGLEKAGQWQAAEEGYKNALTRWPDNLAAYMGLGNSYYAVGDIESAEAAFRVATHRFPTHGSTFYNLAHVLWRRGKSKPRWMPPAGPLNWEDRW